MDCTVSDVLGEGGGSYWEGSVTKGSVTPGSVTPGSVLGPVWWSEEMSFRRTGATWSQVVVSRRAAEFWTYWNLFQTLDNSGHDEGVDKGFCSREGEWWGETGYVVQVEEGSSGDLMTMLSKMTPRLRLCGEELSVVREKL